MHVLKSRCKAVSKAVNSHVCHASRSVGCACGRCGIEDITCWIRCRRQQLTRITHAHRIGSERCSRPCSCLFYVYNNIIGVDTADRILLCVGLKQLPRRVAYGGMAPRFGIKLVPESLVFVLPVGVFLLRFFRFRTCSKQQGHRHQHGSHHGLRARRYALSQLRKIYYCLHQSTFLPFGFPLIL